MTLISIVGNVCAKDWLRCFTTSCNNFIAKGCYEKLHSCENCKCTCEECYAPLPVSSHTADHHLSIVQDVLNLLMVPIVPFQQKSTDSDAVSSSVTGETTYDSSSMQEYVIDNELTLLEKVDNGSIDEEAATHGYSVCSNSNPNPTKNFEGLPFGNSSFVYDRLIGVRQKINLFYGNEYCYKCFMNTGNAFLKCCSLCDNLSFISCGAEEDTLDEEYIPTGPPLFFCCYCTAYKRDLRQLTEDNIYDCGNAIALWGEHTTLADSFARNLYERRMELGRTENEYSDRLYGSTFGPSEALAQSILDNYLDGEEPTEFVCQNCDEKHLDNINSGYLKMELCIDCAMENYYFTLDVEMKRDKRVIMNKRKYNLGFYPASQNFIQLPYHHIIENEDKNIYEKDFTSTQRGEMTKEDLMNFYFNNLFTGDKTECCSFVFRTDMTLEKSSKIQAYFIFDNTYSNPKSKYEFIDVYVQVIVPSKRKLAMLFYRNSGVSIYKLLLVSIVQYADMVKVGYAYFIL